MKTISHRAILPTSEANTLVRSFYELIGPNYPMRKANQQAKQHGLQREFEEYCQKAKYFERLILDIYNAGLSVEVGHSLTANGATFEVVSINTALVSDDLVIRYYRLLAPRSYF